MSALLFVYTILITICVAMAVVFLTLPLPQNPQIKSYRISLHFLAGAYLTFAALLTATVIFNLVGVDILPMRRLTISSLQATLFAVSIITLINPKFVTGSYLVKQVLPVIIFNMLYYLFSWKWGLYLLKSFAELSQHAFQPSVLIREIFTLYYIFQIIYLTNLFFKQFKNYKAEIDNYFSEGYNLYLPWVKYSFSAILSIGIGALLSCFILSDLWMMIFTAFCGFFYLIFGIYYIQYPNTFVKVEPVIYPQDETIETEEKNNSLLVWDEIKGSIVREMYYLRPGITVNDMANQFNTNRTTFSSLLNKNEGHNFNSFINRLRIEHAKQLLIENPDMTLAEISLQCGFTEQSNFTRQFRLLCDETPAVWIKLQRKNAEV